MEDKKYYDEDDIERLLSWMIKNRPGWAESRLAFYARQFPLRDAEIKKLKKALGEVVQKYIDGCMPAYSMYKIAEKAIEEGNHV